MLNPDHTLSRAAYLAQSPGWDLKHEWINGRAYAMAGGTPRHAAVTANVLVALAVALQGSPCRPTSSDQRVLVPATGASLYPDVSVVCGPFETADDDPTAITNPRLVVEVLSPSPADYDRGAKFEHYRRLTSLAAYVLVDPDTPHVTVHHRVAEGWLRRDLHPHDVLRLDALDLTLPIAALYANLHHVP